MGPFHTAARLTIPSILGAALLYSTPALAQHRIRDGGVSREFEVATDEVNVFTKEHRHRAEHISKLVDEKAVRRFAKDLNQLTGEDVEIVLYEKDRPHTVFTRRVLTKEVLVQLAEETSPDVVAQAVGAQFVKGVDYAPGYCLFASTEIGGALDLADRLRIVPGVLSAEPLLARQQSKRFTPNDTLFGDQWHLRNTGQNGGTAGIDVNITNVWDTYRGTNILIAIVDDGLQTTHTDLVGNVNTTIDYDFNGKDGSPNPDVSQDFHGTACGGVCAGKGNNGRGISGAAPEAKLVGLRLIGGPATDQDEADAMTHSNALIYIKSNSWGPNDDGITLAGPGPSPPLRCKAA